MEIRSYINVFAKNEFNTVVAGGKKLIILIIVSTISLWSIGFSSGASKFLKNKMDSPFVKFLTIEIPADKAEDSSYIREIEKRLSDSTNMWLYDIKSYSFTSFNQQRFYTINRNSKSESAKIRMIPPDNELYHFMKKRGFLSDSYVDMKYNPFTIIVTVQFLEKLGYKEYPAFINYRFRSNKGEFSVPIGIAAVVDQLPDKCDIMCAESFFPDLAGYTYDNILDINTHKNDFLIFYSGDIPEETSKSYVLKETRNFKNPTFVDGSTYRVQSDLSDIQLTDLLKKDLEDEFVRIYDLTSAVSDKKSYNEVIYDHLIIEINTLEKIPDFRQFMLSEKNKMELGIDMDVIESRNNFLTFHYVSKILSNVLVLISIGFIIVLIIQTLLQHINRNAKNLGTLKAFGMSNRVIGVTYVGISFVIITIVYAATCLLLAISAELFTSSVLRFVNLDTGGESLFNFYVLLTYFPFFTVLPLVIVGLTIWLKIRNETPGDLIYER
tara:strand:- start:1786 stop:3270 length:1485 start_codon:yes stop_codon:yes gene_type:complete